VNRPLLLRMLPDRLRISLWSRMYRGEQSKWLALYKSASLRHGPGVRMELLPGDLISDYIAFTGVYEPALTRHIAKAARRGGTLVDIGANLGYFPLLWAAGNPSNQCIAFEASPRNIEMLRRNVVQNRLETRIRVVPSAAGARPGKLQFDGGPAGQTGWGGLTLEKNERSLEVNVVRVDEIIPSNDPIAILKVDVEGADAWALMGCERLLKAGMVQEIWYEQNKPRMQFLGIPLDAPQEYLRSVGYKPTPHNDLTDDVVEWSAVRP
jgi:FkbM family methyltransferase